MAAYTVGNLRRGVRIAWTVLKYIIENGLPVKYRSVTHSGISSSSATYADMNSKTLSDLDGNELILVISLFNMTASSTSDLWRLRHLINSVAQMVYNFRGAGLTDGKSFLNVLVSVYENDTAGSFDVKLQWSENGAPVGQADSNTGTTHILIFRRRS